MFDYVLNFTLTESFLSYRVSDFEYTSECIIFDLLEIGLYHGWLVDPQDEESVNAVGKCSYNQLVEKIIQYKQSDNDDMVREGETVCGKL